MDQPNDVDGQMAAREERRDTLAEEMRLCGLYPGKPEWRARIAERVIGEGMRSEDITSLAAHCVARAGSFTRGAAMLAEMIKTDEWVAVADDLRAFYGAATKRAAKKKPEPGESLRTYAPDVSRDRRIFYRVKFEGIDPDHVADEFDVTENEVKAICEQEEKDYASPVDRSKSVRISRQLRRDASREGDS